MLKKKIAAPEKRIDRIESLAPPKGMHDVLPKDMPFWDKVIEATREIADFYNFSRIETPIAEKVELFEKGVGETTDIVEKEMYFLKTKGGDKLVLRPEMTAPVVRSYLQNGLHRLPQPQRLYYFGPAFRYERPQAGRYRQFNQFGFEIIGGDSDPIYDAQVIVASFRLIENLKIKPLIIQISSIGCRICRPGYRKKLVDYYRGQPVCRDCLRRLKLNPLRLLDCKKEVCQPIKAGVPSILDSLCSPCRSHLKQVFESLEEIDLPYTLNPLLVRGLDYYSRTVFEIFTSEEKDGLPSAPPTASVGLALASGGRYDYLAEILGGRPTPGVGVAGGVERLVELLMERSDAIKLPKPRTKIFLVHIGDLAKRRSLSLIEEFRRGNIGVVSALGKNSLSDQLELANKIHSPLALILGQREVYEESIIIRDMITGVQESVPLKKVVEEVKKRLH